MKSSSLGPEAVQSAQATLPKAVEEHWRHLMDVAGTAAWRSGYSQAPWLPGRPTYPKQGRRSSHFLSKKSRIPRHLEFLQQRASLLTVHSFDHYVLEKERLLWTIWKSEPSRCRSPDCASRPSASRPSAPLAGSLVSEFDHFRLLM